MSWTIDFPATLARETHDLTLDQIQSFGLGRMESALQRRGTERAALAQCTLSGFQVGLTAAQLKSPDQADLTGADTQNLLLDVLGAGVQGQSAQPPPSGFAPPPG